ncbi:hypothetical protein [Massilia sp. PWRC2]|uniref:hypothetical protein n=1 Tax=Massilia sp. PWRC2 TaxID=2804626 RepID=UPI003CEA43BC
MRSIDRRVLILAPFVHRHRLGTRVLLDGPEATLSIGNGSILQGAIDQLADGVIDSACTLPPALLEQLHENAMVASLAACPADGAAFLDDFYALCDGWVGDIFASPFWHDFLSGHARPAQVWTFLCQLYRRTEGADVHNRIAAERCRDGAIARLLWRHYEEELGHAAILADGLRQCGGAAVRHLQQAPLASTSALIEFMVQTSNEPLAYLGCYGIFHAPVTIRSEQELVDQFAGYARLYPYAAPAFAAVARHAALDYRLEHDHIVLEQWVSQVGPPGPRGVAAVARGARGAAVAFRAIFDACACVS